MKPHAAKFPWLQPAHVRLRDFVNEFRGRTNPCNVQPADKRRGACTQHSDLWRGEGDGVVRDHSRACWTRVAGDARRNINGDDARERIVLIYMVDATREDAVYRAAKTGAEQGIYDDARAQDGIACGFPRRRITNDFYAAVGNLMQLRVAFRRFAAKFGGIAKQKHCRIGTHFAQHSRGDEAVTAIVALATKDHDAAVVDGSKVRGDEARNGASGVFHESLL